MQSENTYRRLRATSFPLTRLHPARVRRISFTHEDRQLAGFLEARGDGDTPYTVRMQPWGTVTGRIVDKNGKARPSGGILDELGTTHPRWWPTSDWKKPPKVVMTIESSRSYRENAYAEADWDGRFQFDKLIPGQRYSFKIYNQPGTLNETVLEQVSVGAGEVRDLGDLRTKLLSITPEYRQPTVEDQQATEKIAVEAWGEPIHGLRAAIVFSSPAINENDCLSYDLVAENVSERDIHFAAWIHNNDGCSSLRIIDANGKQATGQHGTITRYSGGNSSKLVRFWLKPQERMTISSSIVQLLKLDEQGKPILSPYRNVFYNSLHLKPGQYSISAAVDLGPSIKSFGSNSETRAMVSPLAGEWTGKLQTGVTRVPFIRPK